MEACAPVLSVADILADIAKNKLTERYDANTSSIGMFKRCFDATFTHKLVHGVVRESATRYCWHSHDNILTFELDAQEIVKSVSVYLDDDGDRCVIDYQNQTIRVYDAYDNIIVDYAAGRVSVCIDQDITLDISELNKPIHIKDYKSFPIDINYIDGYKQMLQDPKYLAWYNELKNKK